MDAEPTDKHLRTSPRLLTPSSSFVISTPTKTTMEKKMRESSNVDNSMALSLHVVDQKNAEDPVPLDVYDPKTIESNGKSVRRSSRFNTNNYTTASPESSYGKELSALSLSISKNTLRRTPRFSPIDIEDICAAKLGGKEGHFLVGSKRSGSTLSGSLNRSTFKKAKIGLGEEASNRKYLRRSPRLNKDVDGDSNCMLLALPEPVSSKKSASRKANSNQKYSRKSSRLNPGWCRDKNEKSSSKLLALPAATELKKRDLQNYILSERSLRSRTVQMHVGTEKEKIVKNETEQIECVRGKELSDVGSKSMRSRNVQFVASPKGPPAGTEVSNASVKCLRSRKIEFELADASAGSASKEGTSSANDVRNVAKKYLRPRSIDMEIPAASKESTSIGRETRDAEKCPRSRNTEVKLPDASHTSASKKRASEGSDTKNVAQKHSKLRKMELELPNSPNTPSKGTSAGSHNTTVHKNCSRSRNIDDLGENNIENNTFEESGLDLHENMELNLLEEGTVKCESDVFGERRLRSRKITFKIVEGENVELKPPFTNGEVSKDGESATKSKESGRKDIKHKNVSYFIGGPITEEEAQKRWKWRYELKNSRSKHKNWILNAGEEDETILNVQFHFAQAKVDRYVFNIGDCALIKGEGSKKHIGRILEFFKTMEGEDYFRVQWFYRAEDTVMQNAAASHDQRRVFYSTVENDNPLDCIISKVNIVKRPLLVGLKPEVDQVKFYYDMEYCVEYSTFRNLQIDNTSTSHYLPSNQRSDALDSPFTTTPLKVFSSCGSLNRELVLLDLYSGCGGMSTGLCFGAKLASVNIVTRWAVDLDTSACDSVKLNHPETQVRNESANDFLELLKRWDKLCKRYVLDDLDKTVEARLDTVEAGESNESSTSDSDEEYEVSHLIDICYGDPNDTGKSGIHFKVRWKGYGPEEDTWEPLEGLSNCQEKIQDFVRNGFRSKILPLPGDVDVICGGPPCQGISGYNRYRNAKSPLTDEKNHQIVIFMDIVEFLKPKYVLMENVSDILRFDGASLGRYALSRLVHMKYQARLGTIAAGCYGLPQFRLRVFIWGAVSSEKLPPFPLPTHDVVVRYWPPPEFERNTVAYDEGQTRNIEDAVVLHDAISDLPAVSNAETRDMMPYSLPPETEFQKYIRLSKEEMMGFGDAYSTIIDEHVLYDHRPYTLSEDNYLRVCHVPHRKGASFRDFPGVVVGEDNVVRRDTAPALLPSGEPIAPDCVFNFEKGKSRRPFARLWWDETVPTVLTFPYLLSQAILHPEQDRVLTVRECARLQGFPDFYRFCGTVKERYSQVGNAVAVPVGKALGYAMGLAFQKLVGDEPVMTLPPNFSPSSGALI